MESQMATTESSPLSSPSILEPDFSPRRPYFSPSSSRASSPLSDLSETPPPPELALQSSSQYPSPISSSISSGMQSPTPNGRPLQSDKSFRDADTIVASDMEPPPAKRRKTMPPKERTTEYIDLMKPEKDLTAQDKLQIDRLVESLRKKKKVVVIAGAGISVSAGIPDFRSSTGLFATARTQHKLKASGKHLFDASVYRHDSSTQSFHTMVREMDSITKQARPTPFHQLLASLAQEGRLLRLYSQNIDCIDTSIAPLATKIPLNTKGPWPATVQLHGSLEKMVCTKCGQLSPFKSEIFDGPEAPLCEACVATDQVRTAHAGKRSHGIGRLRPRFVLYNEYNPDEEAIGNVSSSDLKARPDAVVVVGTTLKVPGTRRLVKELCQVTRGRRDGFTAWINVDPAPKGAEFKDCWDLVVRSKCDEVARLAQLPPWDCNIGEDYLVSQEQDVENQARQKGSILEIAIKSKGSEADLSDEPEPPKLAKLESVQGMLTPQPSPELAAIKQPGRVKQTQLPFGRPVTKKTETKHLKKTASKPRGRKSLPNGKADQPQRTLGQDFKSVKKVESIGLSKKSSSNHPRSAPLGPLDSLDNNLPPLVSDEELPAAGEIKIESTKTETVPLRGNRVVTPPTSDRPIFSDTISPKSTPRGMAAMIHLESN